MIPCQMGYQEVKIETIIVEGDISWILGRNTMKNLGMVIDVQLGVLIIEKLFHVNQMKMTI